MVVFSAASPSPLFEPHSSNPKPSHRSRLSLICPSSSHIMRSTRLLPSLLSLLAPLVACADISTLAGPFTLIATPDSTSPPTTITGYLDLFYEAPSSTPQVLWLFLLSSSGSYNEQFQLNSGVLGTSRLPDDGQGSLPYNATTPAGGAPVAFSPQYAAHAGFDVNDGYLAIHGNTDNTWYLCPYTYSGSTFSVLTYAASTVTGCTETRVFVQD